MLFVLWYRQVRCRLQLSSSRHLIVGLIRAEMRKTGQPEWEKLFLFDCFRPEYSLFKRLNTSRKELLNSKA